MSHNPLAIFSIAFSIHTNVTRRNTSSALFLSTYYRQSGKKRIHIRSINHRPRFTNNTKRKRGRAEESKSQIPRRRKRRFAISTGTRATLVRRPDAWRRWLTLGSPPHLLSGPPPLTPLHRRASTRWRASISNVPHAASRVPLPHPYAPPEPLSLPHLGWDFIEGGWSRQLPLGNDGRGAVSTFATVLSVLRFTNKIGTKNKVHKHKIGHP